MNLESEAGHTFKERPDIGEIRKLIEGKQFLNTDSKQTFELTDIDPKSPSGHWNFLVKQGNQSFVFRMVGDEKPVAGNEIEQEYNILQHVAEYDVAPKPYYFSKTDFKEPFLLEEFLDGRLFTQLDEEEQRRIIPEVANLIARINKIPITEEIRGNLKPINTYQQNFQTWENRLADISKDSQYDPTRTRIESLIPKAINQITKYSSILESTPESFVFKSAHAGHCIKTDSGLRFLNWEEAGYGDPSYSLAVFLSSIRNHNDFEEIKETIIKSYLERTDLVKEGEFRELLDTRLFERLVSDTTWPVWMAAIQKRPLTANENSVIEQRISEIKKALRS